MFTLFQLLGYSMGMHALWTAEYNTRLSFLARREDEDSVRAEWFLRRLGGVFRVGRTVMELILTFVLMSQVTMAVVPAVLSLLGVSNDLLVETKVTV